jgi:maltose O-acetyltransferase
MNGPDGTDGLGVPDGPDGAGGEKENMLAGRLYRAWDPLLIAERARARGLLSEINGAAGVDKETCNGLLRQLFGAMGKNVGIQPPFYCDYGKNIQLGDDVFFNFNCVILDPARVVIGDRSLFGPNVQIYTATHPMESAVRATGVEAAKEIHIGSDVWVGGSAVILPGVRIGSRSVIGAGSVVTKDVPENVVVAGNPARVIRKAV